MRAEIRPARREDVDDVLRLWREAGSAPTVTDDEQGLLALLRHDPGALLVAEADGQLLGSLIAGWNGWRGGLYRLAVARAHRRRGLAGALLDAGEQRLRELGARRIDAVVAADEPHAVAFWDSTRFEREPKRLRYVCVL
jgi:ribosomal protein S18 acetylase RimI-like enzyme